MYELSLLDEILIWLGLKEKPISKTQAEAKKPEPEKVEPPSEPKPQPEEPEPQYPSGTPKSKTRGAKRLVR